MAAATGLLLDIEGTTTPIAFVYDVLFPYVRRKIDEFFIPNNVALALKAEHDLDPEAEPWLDPISYAKWLMDRDRKSTALKELQGLIWLRGYRSGELCGEVFPDVPGSLANWRDAGVDIRIYSSGSILAQRLLFSTASAGDLTQFLNGYFDTTTGPKTEPASYTRIAECFGIAPGRILFVSDVVRELDAAHAAGLKSVLCIRPGNDPQPVNRYETISTFDQITTDRSWPPE